MLAALWFFTSLFAIFVLTLKIYYVLITTITKYKLKFLKKKMELIWKMQKMLVNLENVLNILNILKHFKNILKKESCLKMTSSVGCPS